MGRNVGNVIPKTKKGIKKKLLLGRINLNKKIGVTHISILANTHVLIVGK